MNCPRCNAKVAFVKDQCGNCGLDLRNHRRIISLSNVYYNKGLEQAKVRDLSGAICSLRKSLEFNKKNTNARNLLGLIFFEVGEIVSALSEWVISKHFQPKNNDADMYIREVQANPNRLDIYNQTLKKYNSALASARNGDADMAIIQLKKVVNLNPRFVRAAQLLALLYMMTGKRDNRVRAKKLLLSVSKIDVTDTTTIRYLKELSDIHLKGEAAVKKADNAKPQMEGRKILPRVEPDAYKTITPYKEEKPSVLPFINVIVGVVIGMALMGFLIMPHISSKQSEQANSEFNKYSEQKASNDSDVSTLENENEELTEQVEELQQEIAELTGESGDGAGFQESYENLVTAMQYYLDNDALNAAKSLAKVNKDALESETSLALYKKIKAATYEQASQELFEQGRDAYNGEGTYAGNQDYDKAIKLLKQALKYNKDNTDAMYFLGRCYQQKSDAETAKEYYNQIVNDYPDSYRVAEAQSRLRELGE
ncbi:MAG: tetratricopeptide repeat protein [Clostridiaceae bacterium]|nr:tetratricopeptide repeat protein [Clostridiaceae bacterium]